MKGLLVAASLCSCLSVNAACDKVLLTTLRAYMRDISPVAKFVPKNEERELIEKAQKGDTASRNRIVETSLKFVIHLAYKYMNKGVPLEDLIQEGNIGALKAVQKYDLNYHVNFCTYAQFAIRQRMWLAVQRNNQDVNIGDNDFPAKEKIEQEDSKTVALIEQVFNKMDKLSTDQAEVIKKWFGLDGSEPKSLTQIADELGITRQGVHSLKTTALRKLRKD